MYLIRKTPLTRPWQGDIYEDVIIIQDITYIVDSEGKRKPYGNEVKYDYSIVLNQECDLEQDYNYRINDKENHDKYIPMILMVPAYSAEDLRHGDHLKKYGQKMQSINSDDWGKVKGNQNKRYHYLKRDLDNNIPELVIDFKHFFTMSRVVVYNEVMNLCYKASLTILYREELSQRFCNFISRIGIPNDPVETKLLTDSLCSGPLA